MASAARPCVQVSSVVELPKSDPRPPRSRPWPQLLTGQRKSPRFILVSLLLVFFSGVRIFLESVIVDKPIPAAEACPSENELRTEHHFRSWDEKLEQALRLSGQGPPKTEEEAWHAVTDDIHVFAAFVATTTVHAIHITALVRGQKANTNRIFTPEPPLLCIIRTSKRTTRKKARIRLVWTWYNPIFWNAFILCRPPTEVITASEDIRVAVAVKGADEDSWRWLQLRHPPEKLEEKCCAVCVRPMFGSKTSLWKLVEFVTHYRTLGARRFYFYDLDMSSGVKLLLARLQSSGVDMTLVPFKLIASTDDVHASAQMPALYDCIFRSMSTTEYYIHVDLDELIVPARHYSIPALVQEEERKRNDVGSIVVSHRYMCAEYPMNVQYADHKYLPLQTRLFPFHSEAVTHGGLHEAHRSLQGYLRSSCSFSGSTLRGIYRSTVE
ncbi:hypothetical protein MTO96_006840 [Rhipicephalus appendiculatus]